VPVDDASVELLARWRQGDQQAADELFGRYTEQLIALARSHLSAKLARRVDPEDVVQSAYRSFCAGAREDRYVLRRSGDLWRLLAAITLHKLHRQVERHTAGKRSVGQEESAAGPSSRFGPYAEAVARAPSPAEAAAAADELEHLMRPLKPLHRRILEMRLQGYLLEEIAAQTERTERLVRWVLEKVKSQWQQRCQEGAGS
jgi:RNA polymerase sigma factor (sigma-70 family)